MADLGEFVKKNASYLTYAASGFTLHNIVESVVSAGLRYGQDAGILKNPSGVIQIARLASAGLCAYGLVHADGFWDGVMDIAVITGNVIDLSNYNEKKTVPTL